MKKRRKCAICHAKKYIKFLKKEFFDEYPDKEFYICINGSKCIKRSANYRK